MRRFWATVVALEAVLLTAFYFKATAADYFRRMPASVRHGASVEWLVAERTLWLAAILVVMNVCMALWIVGTNWINESEMPSGIAARVLSVLMFVLALVMFAAFVLFGFAQY